jgi:predicted RNA-binding Zn-ribbon protein involved in translation (DUF1610 family)
METIRENEELNEKEKYQRLKKAKGSTWYDGWKPYCLNCSSILRMEQKSYGFQCSKCDNIIGWNLKRLKESPLNYGVKREFLV